METTFLLRVGELTLKSAPVRKRMTQRMLNNLKDAFIRNQIQANVRSTWSRLFVSTPQPEQVAHILSHLFGLQSFSKIERYKYEQLEDLLDIAEQHFAKEIDGVRFEVRARREKKNPLSTREIEQTLGGRLMDHGGIVDLTTPELTCSIELRKDEAYFFSTKLEAPAGLPLGTESRALSLISGGFDSPVATWKALRRGVPCDFIFFELGGLPQRASIYAHLEHLYQEWIFGYTPRLYIIPGEPIVEALQTNIPQKYWNVMLKRVFYRVSERIALRRKYTALVTGEAIAQVSSQTLLNLQAIQHGLSVPVLRPLVAEEKNDIIALSRKIGSHDISAQVQEYCAITPKNAATRSTPERVLEFEEDLGGDAFYESLEALAERIHVSEVSPAQIPFLEYMLDEIPEDAIWVDMREQAGEALPLESLPISMEELVTQPEQLDQEQTYFLLCDVGMLSGEAAYMLNEMGYKAFAFKGGISKLRKRYSTIEATVSSGSTTIQIDTDTE